MKLIIIEDEAKTGRELKLITEELRPGYEVLAILPSVKATLKWLEEHRQPDLILSDIQLSDGLSFDIFRQVKMEAPIIFCTAFDEYAIRAFETCGIDYLLKPVDDDKLNASFEKYEALKAAFATKEPSGYQERLSNLAEQMTKGYKSSLLVHFKDKIIPIKAEAIAFVYSVGGIVTVHTTTGEKHYISYTLDELEQVLNPADFFRANRQYIINRAAIHSAEHFFTRRLAVKLQVDTPEKIIISKVKATTFLSWMEGA